MNENQKTVARTCLEAAEGNTMTFPQIVETLMEAGFESLCDRVPAGECNLLPP